MEANDKQGLLVPIEGDIRVNGPFLERIEQVVRAAVEESLSRFAAGGDKAHGWQVDRSAARDGLVLAPGEQRKARTARQESGLQRHLRDEQGMMNSKALASFLAISERFLYTLLAEGALPKPINLGGRTKRWPIEEILAWVMNGCPHEERWALNRIRALREFRSVTSGRG